MSIDGIFTSESVLPGHPDKICDRISDAVLDFYLSQDSNARVACETFATTNVLIIGGEMRSIVKINKKTINDIALKTIKDFGENEGFDTKKIKITNLIHQQSKDIAIGVDAKKNQSEGAGDQGLMFGFACDENEELMPSPILYCHKILKEIYDNIKSKKLKNLGPDGKIQLSFEYKNGRPVAIKTVVCSIQHSSSMSIKKIENEIKDVFFQVVKNKKLITKDPVFLINQTGKFVIGGPNGDTGLTGRKIIVDTYGGFAPHGGGAFSGKDPTKVDRSGSYIARYLAKNIVHAKLASKCLIQISYCIGKPEPTSILIDTFGTSKKSNAEILKSIQNNIDLTPRSLINILKLNKPIYYSTAHFGHFGHPYNPKTGEFSWEKLDKIF